MIKFREIIKSDRLQMISLLSQLTTTPDISEDDFNNFIKNKSINLKIYVILDNDKIVGCGSLLIEPKIIHGMQKVGHIEDIVIDKKYRNKGYGQNIIKFLSWTATQNDCYKVILDCSLENKEFYKKCGFIDKGISMAKYF